jgi:hypothetical protein
LKRGVLLRMTRDSEPEWFYAQYEKLPFFCFSCGLIGHRGLGCDKPVVRNAQGKLPYDRDIPLRAPDDRRKKIQSFMEAAAESYGSGSSSNNRSARSTSGKQGRHGAESREEAQHEPRNATDGREKNDEEVLSPLKRRAPESQGKETETSGAGKQLFQDVKNAERKQVKKRKSERSGTTSSLAPDLNLPCTEGTTLVPPGLVSSRVNQFVGAHSNADGEEDAEELIKKQKRATNTTDARSVVAAEGSPAGHNESLKFELSWVRGGCDSS